MVVVLDPGGGDGIEGSGSPRGKGSVARGYCLPDGAWSVVVRVCAFSWSMEVSPATFK